MEELLEWMEIIEDIRQRKKVKHSIKDIWVQNEDFALWNEDYLKQYIPLKNGVPSHDTIQRVMGMIRPENLQQLQLRWQELLNSSGEEKFKRIICVDGKTMRSNKRNGSKPCHTVSAWSRGDGYCLGQRTVEEESNELTAIPKVLENIAIKGAGRNHRRNGDTDGDCGDNKETPGGLCAGGKGKPRESGDGYPGVFRG